MELEEMKTLWCEMSAALEKQKKLTGTIIMSITEAGYQKKINRIMIPEIIGSLVCIAALLFIVVNFSELSTWYLQACGIITVCILIALPVLSFKAIAGLRSVDIMHHNYRQSLTAYAKGKKQFVWVQKLGFMLGAILLLVLLPVVGQLIDGKDLFKITRIWLWYCIAFPFFYSLSKWIFRSYMKTVDDAENLLKDLQTDSD